MPIVLSVTFVVFGALHVVVFWLASEFVPLLGALCFCAAGIVALLAKWSDVWREGVLADVIITILMVLAVLAMEQTRNDLDVLIPAWSPVMLIVLLALVTGGGIALRLFYRFVKSERLRKSMH